MDGRALRTTEEPSRPVAFERESNVNQNQCIDSFVISFTREGCSVLPRYSKKEVLIGTRGLLADGWILVSGQRTEMR